MLSHVTIAVSDFERALAFYEKLLGSIGLVRSYYNADTGAASFRKPDEPRPLFFIVGPFDGEEADPGNGPMTAFLCLSRSEVDKVHALGLSLGATDEGAPGLRPHYHENYYGCYLRDTEGHKICFVCHDPCWVRQG